MSNIKYAYIVFNIRELCLYFAIVHCVGTNSINACNDIDAYKIALFEDVQDQIQIIRTFLSINKSGHNQNHFS